MLRSAFIRNPQTSTLGTLCKTFSRRRWLYRRLLFLLCFWTCLFPMFCSISKWLLVMSTKKQDFVISKQSHHLLHWEERCHQREWREQWDSKQNQCVVRYVSVRNLSLFKANQFGHFQQHPLYNSERLDQVCAVCIANEQTASGVTISPVLCSNCT